MEENKTSWNKVLELIHKFEEQEKQNQELLEQIKKEIENFK